MFAKYRMKKPEKNAINFFLKESFVIGLKIIAKYTNIEKKPEH